MDYAACNVVYVDRGASGDRLWRRADVVAAESAGLLGSREAATSPALLQDLKTLLHTFSEVHLCARGHTCIEKVAELNRTSGGVVPTILLLDIPNDSHAPAGHAESEPAADMSKGVREGRAADAVATELYGLGLLQFIAAGIHAQSISKLVVPIAVVRGAAPEPRRASLANLPRTRARADSARSVSDSLFAISRQSLEGDLALDSTRTIHYLEVGAVDVLTSPLLSDRLPSLAIHAYRAHKAASSEQTDADVKSNRKRSWVGLDEQKPYAYLREAMVSGLMDGICRLEPSNPTPSRAAVQVSEARQAEIAKSVGVWDFSAHDFSDDELIHAASVMFKHALQMPDLEAWRISDDGITAFLSASRLAYNAFVPYHNFRHVVDVLQAVFHFLVRLGRLPPYPHTPQSDTATASSSIASLIRPFDALTLLITAIGHDVGHPGVNNAFLVVLNAPLAQLYNDRSVLESFHCAAYSQILRRHWPVAFNDCAMRRLMINSILATDMGLHFDYMKQLGFLQERLHENAGTAGWNGRTIEDSRVLACSLLIKCADISNVARRYHVATRWAYILIDEFSRQASMEKDLGMTSTLFAPPVRDTIPLGKSQIGFMNMFAMPLFQGVTDIMPDMAFCVEEIQHNIKAWEEQIATEHERQATSHQHPTRTSTGIASPRSMSVTTGPTPARTGSNLRMQAIFNETSAMRDGTSGGWPSPKRPSQDSTSSSPLPSPAMTQESISPGSITSPISMPPRSAKPQQTAFDTPIPESPPPSSAVHELQAYDGEAATQHQASTTPGTASTDPVSAMQYGHHAITSKLRSSDSTTEGSSSVSAYWGEQASNTSVLGVGKERMPLSPSTQATSFISDLDEEADEEGKRRPKSSHFSNGALTPRDPHDHGQRPHTSQHASSSSIKNRLCQKPNVPPAPTSAPFNASHGSMTSRHESAGHGEKDGSNAVDPVRTVRKKPSRFRLSFWRKNNHASKSPAMPDDLSRDKSSVASGDERSGSTSSAGR